MYIEINSVPLQGKNYTKKNNMKKNPLTNKWESDYWHPTMTTDAVIFGFDGEKIDLLLIKRAIEPFKDCWALPGGFLKKEDVDAKACAYRELKEESCIDLNGIQLEELKSYSAKDRDPRERVITIAFVALVPKSKYADVKGADDAREAKWFSLDELPPLAFDHQQIVEDAHNSLKQRIHFEPIGFHLLDKEFTIAQLHSIYKAILQPKEADGKGKYSTLNDKKNFARKLLKLKYIEATGKKSQEATPYKRPELFTFVEDAYNKAKEDGIWLEL